MVEFAFTINRSFLHYSSHPITIPRTQVDYSTLDKENLLGAVTIILPSGRTVRGQVYSGTAGFGPYHQIRASSPTNAFADLELGSQIVVRMERNHSGVVARLRAPGV
jgi:hypothetical protein